MFIHEIYIAVYKFFLNKKQTTLFRFKKKGQPKSILMNNRFFPFFKYSRTLLLQTKSQIKLLSFPLSNRKKSKRILNHTIH